MILVSCAVVGSCDFSFCYWILFLNLCTFLGSLGFFLVVLNLICEEGWWVDFPLHHLCSSAGVLITLLNFVDRFWVNLLPQILIVSLCVYVCELIVVVPIDPSVSCSWL